ncbi:GNAT family N-acetyltransferase [Maritalea mediterranea]|uniref:GNAT family N-acetyltransferase n=1 Tax=Maritalea mediterranea TaxID=2909667 RepID=A0ABS9E273_9HYPH|nr:GNAT family N-acetyltransferase [Maritalea mediterranea]MCF4096957.1 GNAT family N-acetyltransferase [Maritalea mediterranea]
MSPITLHHHVPTPEEYCEMRVRTGLSPKSLEGARIGMANSLYGVCLRDEAGQLVGMGRLIGDGGCFVQICDIAVDPAHQGRGLGQQIMQALLDHIHAHMPDLTWVNLFADGDAHHLYKKFGFEMTAPLSQGMAFRLRKRA